MLWLYVVCRLLGVTRQASKQPCTYSRPGAPRYERRRRGNVAAGFPSNAVAGLQRVDVLQKLEAATQEMERGAVAGMTAGERSLGDLTAARLESQSAAINTRIEQLRAASLLIQLWKLTGELNREKVPIISNGLRLEHT